MDLVAVEKVSFAYGEHGIFQDLSFTVNQGEIFCLLGPNGCGKTTLLDCILGFHQLCSGRIVVLDKDIRHVRAGKLARSLAYVPQKHERTFPYTVREIVTMGRAAYLGMFDAPTRSDRRLAEEALETIGIAHLGDRPYTQLSGGETQLVMIARALVQHAPVVVLDEPTAHLDFRYEMVIMETISRLVKENGLSILMATHFPNHAFYFENAGIKISVALLHRGGFLAVGPPECVLDEEKLQELYSVNARVVTVDGDGQGRLKHSVPISQIGENTNSR